MSISMIRSLQRASRVPAQSLARMSFSTTPTRAYDDERGGYGGDRGGYGGNQSRGGYGDREGRGGGGRSGYGDRQGGGGGSYSDRRGGGGYGSRPQRRAPQGTPSDTRVFVAGLPWTVRDNDLAGFFEEFNPTDVTVVMDRIDPSRSKGFGFLRVADKSTQEALIAKFNGAEMDGRTLVVNAGFDRTEQPRSDPEY
ncbi:uncharacterized protein L969DRAFT_54168 [Mixia osmundae IAM 14324]|uniref:RRM domain-containing protein n=1 Tax=Mixia osmundae (strain CBS 9802 / IAM 14324 / JCM 22182 / KY 12970) TaxID=764103 RepID=G7E2F8_MIXOS|nr:uncharacterized protein L969DRAFT_54168 [Mixia osmundae IAM 14324]KEI36888.1 hypothetical protein L969DRAFT_54168 [Mixia osmundae IAM 14324]GAA97018.1 hypothetical protein E5Q_03693 [Mixia osmundae IAM 14324]